MGISLKDMIASLDVKRRKRIEERAAALVAEEKSRRDLKRESAVQDREESGIKQDWVSRVKEGGDLKMYTPRRERADELRPTAISSLSRECGHLARLRDQQSD